MTNQQVQLLSALIPVVAQLSKYVIDFSIEAQNEGYIVPSKKELSSLKEQIDELEMLGTQSRK